MKATQPTPTERFWSHVDKSGGPGACWPWLLKTNDKGYPLTSWDGRGIGAHRVALRLSGADISGLQVDHECHNADTGCPGGPCVHRRCCNPAHLRAVTPGDNVRASDRTPASLNLAKTHCPQGHPYDAANTYRHKHGRACRICGRANWRRYSAKRKAAA